MYFNKKDNDLPLLSTEEFLEGLRKEYPLTFITEVKESPKPVVKVVEKKEKEEDLYKKRIEDAILEKINFTNIPEGYYTNLPICPGIEALKKLGSKKKKTLNVPIPLTILYNKGDVQWICNDRNGAIEVKEAPSDWKTKFIEKCTEYKTLDFDFDNIPIAIAKIPEFTNPTSYDTRPLILSELKKMLDDNIESFIVQKYIQSKGNKSALYRVLWRSSRNTYAYNCSNKAKYKDKELKQKQKEWKEKKETSSKDERSKLWWEYEQTLNKYFCVRIKDPKSYDYVRIFGESIDEIEAWTYCIIHHLEDVTVPGMKFRFETFGTDWIKDNNNCWWFIGIKAFELQKQTFDTLKKWKEDLEKCLQSNGEFAEIRGLPELKVDNNNNKQTLKEMDESLSVGKICGLCKYRYLLWEEKEFTQKHNKPLWYNLTNKMIADLISYLHLRGIDAECFHLYPVVNEINKYMSVSICHLCYTLYQSAQKLINTSFIYKDCLVPPQTVNESNSYRFELLKREKIPDNSTYHRMFIAFYYFTVLNDSIPIVEAKDSYGEIRYNFGTKTYNIPFDLSKWNESYCPIKQFRIHNFLSNTEGLINYLTTNITMNIFLGSNTKNLIQRTKCVVNLDKFTVGGKKQVSSDLVDFDLTLLIEDLPPFIMKLSIGVIEDPELLIAPEYEFYGDVFEERRNIFYPPSDFTDCHPIPQEWYFTLNNFKFEVFQNNIKQEQINRTKKRRSSTASHASTIKALRRKAAEEKDVAEKHELLLDKIFKRFITIKIDYNLLSDYIHRLFRYYEKDIENDYLDSETVLTAFRSYNHYDYNDLPLVTAILAIADFIDYYSDVHDKWIRNDFKCIIYHMLKGDIYDTIAAMPVKHHQRHRFDNYLYLYQFADPQLNNCADVSELRSILTNIDYYVKDPSSPLILYSKWILQSDYYQDKCKEYDAFGKGTILFPEFCIVCEQTFRYLSLDENNHHLGNCSKHGNNCKFNSLVNMCDKCLRISNQSTLNLLEKNKGNFLTTLLNKPTPAIPKNDVIERISLSSWNTPRTETSDSEYSGSDSGSEPDICDDIEFYVNSVHQSDSVTKDSLMMLEENMNSRRVYSRTHSRSSDISDLSENNTMNNNEDYDLRRSIQRKLSPTDLKRKIRNKRSISPVVSPNKSKRKPQSAQVRSHPLYPHVKTHMRPASSSPDINQSTVKPSEISDNLEKPPLYNSNSNNNNKSSPNSNRKRRIHSAKSSNITLKKKLIRRPQSSAPVLSTNRNNLNELLKDVTDSVERLHKINAAEKYETGKINRIRSANHNLYTLPERYQPTEPEKELDFTEEIVLEHNNNNNNDNNNVPVVSQSSPSVQTIRIEYDQPIHHKKKRYKNKRQIPTPTKSPNMNTKLIWRARENRKIFQHLIDRSDSKQQIKLKTMEKTMLIYVKYVKLDKVEELLKEGVSPDTKDTESPCRSLLHIAVRQGSLSLVELLLQYGADPNIEDELGCTPCSEAIIQKQYHIYQCLNKAGGK